MRPFFWQEANSTSPSCQTWLLRGLPQAATAAIEGLFRDLAAVQDGGLLDGTSCSS